MTDLSAWPALILTAGLASRLRPLSLVRAKAALPIAGEVLVRRVLRWLHAAGVRRVVLNLHHLPETITARVGDGGDLGLDVRYSWESTVLGSAGGPRRALSLLDADRFLIVNGDTLTDASLSELTDRHVSSGARVTMTVTNGDARYGGVLVDDRDIVRGFAAPLAPEGSGSPTGIDARVESRAPQRCHFVGIQAVERLAFERVAEGRPAETVRWLYPELIAESPGAVRAHRTSAAFHDIGTPADYRATVRRFGGYAGAAHVGRDARIDPSARVTGSILWDRVTIGADAEVVDCIVADEATIPPGAAYRDKAIIARNGQISVYPI